MGIVGLTSLVEVNPHLLTDFELRDMNLVVDGLSFCHQLYHARHIDCRFGGDYAKFEKTITEILDKFAYCNVKLFFVFDGPLDTQSVKYHTAVNRHKSRISNAKLLTSAARLEEVKVLPLFAQSVLSDVLEKRKNIAVFRCAGEADAVSARLANSLCAPVLSLDSDFFIFDLKYGYVPFDTVEFQETPNPTRPYLRGKLYLLGNFLEHYPKLDRRLLPLFAFLSGNDFSQGYDLSKFLNNLHKPANFHSAQGSSTNGKTKKGALRPMQRHINMLGILEFLSEKQSADEAIQAVLAQIEKERREKLRAAIENSVALYNRANCVENSEENFDVRRTIFEEIRHLNLPQWFVDDYVDGKTPASILQILQDRYIFLKTLVEDFSSTSVYDVSTNLRRAVYGILLKNRRENERAVLEIARDGGEIRKREVRIEDFDDRNYPDLKTSDEFSKEERQNLFYSIFELLKNENDAIILGKFPEKFHLFLAAYIFWCRADGTTVKRNQAFALLIYCLWSDEYNGEKICKKSPVKEYDFTPNISTKKGEKLAVDDLHVFSQFQACFMAAEWLDCILKKPFGETVPVQNMISGRIVYNLCQKAKNTDAETQILQHFLCDFPESRALFLELFSFVEPYLTKPSVTVKKRSGNSGKKNVQSTKENGKKENMSSEKNAEIENEKDSESDDDKTWMLENRFGALRI